MISFIVFYIKVQIALVSVFNLMVSYDTQCFIPDVVSDFTNDQVTKRVLYLTIICKHVFEYIKRSESFLSGS